MLLKKCSLSASFRSKKPKIAVEEVKKEEEFAPAVLFCWNADSTSMTSLDNRIFDALLKVRSSLFYLINGECSE